MSRSSAPGDQITTKQTPEFARLRAGVFASTKTESVRRGAAQRLRNHLASERSPYFS